MAILNLFKPSQPSEAPKPGDSFQIPPLPIRGIIDHERRQELLSLESHLRGTQHAHKKYDWEANIYGGEVQVKDYVPMRKRRPCVSLRMGKLIVKRLTTMICGHERFPTIAIEGDEEAEDYVRELAKEAKLRTKLVEARNKGGAAGSVAISWAFSKGKPSICVHSAAVIEVLEWADFEERIPSRVLKAYDYQKRVMVEGAMKKKTFWFARYWDENVEVTWPKIPDEIAKRPEWVSYPHETVEHGAGECPVVWVQNIPDSDSVDGVSDFDGQKEDFDELDRLASATERGTIANVDPTLVIHDSKGRDEGIVRKGSGSVIYSKGGARYLELQGSAVETSLKLLEALKDGELEEAEVVLLDPKELSGSGVSAAALRTRFAPMLAKCDLLRDQYGEAMVRVLKSMLEASRHTEGIVLEPRLEKIETEDDDEKETVYVERSPGISSNITLKWPPYFPATWQDRKEAIEAGKAATNRQVLSRKTMVESIGPLFDIEDADSELERIEEDEERSTERARGMFEAGGPVVPVQPSTAPEPDEDLDDDEEA